MESSLILSHQTWQFIVYSAGLLGYLDPGSGSFILQLILASLVGSLFVFKSFWRRLISAIRGFFSRDRSNKAE